MYDAEFPILEFDPDPEAHLEPSRILKPVDVAQACVLVFFRDVVEKLVAEHDPVIRATQVSEMGRVPLYEIAVRGQRLAFFHIGVGAALAGAFLAIALAGPRTGDAETRMDAIAVPMRAVLFFCFFTE